MNLKTISQYIFVGFAIFALATGVQAEELSVTDLAKGGNKLNTSAVDAGSDSYVNDDRTVLKVKSDTTASGTVTVNLQKGEFSSPGFGTISFDTITVNVTDEVKYIRAPERIYNNSKGRAVVDYSGGTTAISVAVFKRPND